MTKKWFTSERILKRNGISLDGIAISIRTIFFSLNKKCQIPRFCEVSQGRGFKNSIIWRYQGHFAKNRELTFFIYGAKNY